MEDTLKLILDKLSEMDNKINAMDNKINAMDNKINAMDAEIKEVKSIQLRMEDKMDNNFKALYDAREVNFDDHKRIEDKIDTIHNELSSIEKVTIKNSADIIDLQAYRKEN